MIRDDVFEPARVEALRDLSPTVREFTLRPAGGVLPWTVGAHLRVQVRLQEHAQQPVHPGESPRPDAGPTERSYSLVGLPGEPCYRIAVKRVPASRGGSRFMWGLQPGDTLPVSRPQNSFELPLHAGPTLLVAGGIGITPLLGMALQLAARGADVQLLYAAHSGAELVYAQELRAALGERLRTFDGAAGQRLDLPAAIGALPPGARLLLCGPVRLLQAAQADWARAGRSPAQLRFETFGSGGTQQAVPFRVRLPRHALELQVPADRSLLDVLEAHGVPMLSECRKGECGLCAVDVVSTDAPLDHRDVFFSPRQKEQGNKLCACVSRACGGTLVLDTAYRADPAPTIDFTRETTP
jgi:ferredoxin-NADP reductase